MPSGNQALGQAFPIKYQFVRLDIPGSIYPITGNGIPLNRIFFMYALMPRNAFSNHMAEKTRLPNTIILQDIIGRTFITVAVKNRAGKIDLEKMQFAFFIHLEIEAGITYAIESFKDALGGFTKLLRDDRIITGYIGVGVKFTR